MGKKHLKKALTFFTAFATASLLAYANSDFETAKETLSQEVARWADVIPGFGQIDTTEYLDLSDIQEQQKETDQAIAGHLKKLDRELIQVFDGAKAIVNEVIDQEDWKKGINNAIQGRQKKSVEKALTYNQEARDEQAQYEQSSTTGSDTYDESNPDTTGGQSLDQKLNTLSNELLQLDHNKEYWRVRTATLRLNFDEKFIREIINVNNVPEDVINTFAMRLSGASQQKESLGDFSKIYAELIMLHIYLNPERGLGDISLGLPKETSFSNAITHNKMSNTLTGLASTSAKTQKDSLKQVLLEQGALEPLMAALHETLSTHSSALLTLNNDNSEVQMSIAMTAVFNDLYQYKELRDLVKQGVKQLADVSRLWTVRTCLHYLERRKIHGNTSQCEALAYNDDASVSSEFLANVISTQIINRKEPLIPDRIIELQVGYAAQILRVMAGMPAINWKQF
ncbi:hypothetical protein [Parendozoicomonas sp. Alg238-R29]|uniref:hypothetical protein n=1 Tax=Parendozoicomonas sp. Alg238-R29 TaxID=2993446 RepID=UPI00248D7C0C|nr:hypothetical protein [Parendozoicomonas sp. Alg238-R29]